MLEAAERVSGDAATAERTALRAIIEEQISPPTEPADASEAKEIRAYIRSLDDDKREDMARKLTAEGDRELSPRHSDTRRYLTGLSAEQVNEFGTTPRRRSIRTVLRGFRRCGRAATQRARRSLPLSPLSRPASAMQSSSSRSPATSCRRSTPRTGRRSWKRCATVRRPNSSGSRAKLGKPHFSTSPAEGGFSRRGRLFARGCPVPQIEKAQHHGRRRRTDW